METLIINGVDLELLEQQRLVLGEAVSGYNQTMSTPQRRALVGVVGMLDVWSDGRMEANEQE